MKNKIKALAALALVLCTVLPLASCNPANKPVKLTNVFRVNTLEMPEMFDYVNQIGCSGDMIWFYGYDRETYDPLFYTMGLDGTPGDKIKLGGTDEETGTSSSVNTICVSGDKLWGVVNSWGYDAETDTYTDETSLSCFTLDGTQIKSIDLKDIIDTEDEYVYINSLSVGNDGSLYMTYQSTVYIADSEGSPKNKIELEGVDYIEKMLCDAKGNILVFYYDSVEYNLQVKTIDPATGELGGDYSLDDLAKTNTYRMTASTDPNSTYELFFNTQNGVYGYDAEQGLSVEVLNWINSDINSNNVGSFFMLGDNEAVCYIRNYNTDTSELLKLERIPDDEVVPKTVLTMACHGLDYDLREQIVQYNRNNETYRIQIEDYSVYRTEDDYQYGITKLNNDIVSGKVPDIMIINSQMPYDNYAARGMFADIYEFIDGDEVLNRSDFLENYLGALSYDGKLFMLAPSFYVNTFAAKTKFVGDTNALTMDEFRAAVDSARAENEKMTPYQDITRDNLLQLACVIAYDEFVDKNTGKCTFDSDEFIKVLEFARELDPKSIYEDINYDELDEQFWLDQETAFRDDRVMFSQVYLSGYSAYWRQMKGQFGEEISLIGFPTKGENGSAFEISDAFAISARSRHKDAAWDFIRTYFLDDYQMKVSYGFPITHKALAHIAELESTMPELDEYGYTQYDPENPRQPTTYYYIANEQIDIGVIDDEHIAKLNDFLGSITKLMRYDEDVMEIIREEASYYFEGQRSAAEAADLIQRRVSIYVSENR